jgi:hypothetical protein
MEWKNGGTRQPTHQPPHPMLVSLALSSLSLSLSLHQLRILYFYAGRREEGRGGRGRMFQTSLMLKFAKEEGKNSQNRPSSQRHRTTQPTRKGVFHQGRWRKLKEKEKRSKRRRRRNEVTRLWATLVATATDRLVSFWTAVRRIVIAITRIQRGVWRETCRCLTPEESGRGQEKREESGRCVF